MKKFYLLLLLFASSKILMAQIYVTQEGKGDKDGTSWEHAYAGTQLQKAINDAANATDKEVWVAKGTYKPTESLSSTGFLTDGITPVTDRDNSFLLMAGVGLYGGFSGSETSKDGRTEIHTTNKTILSGDLNNNNVADDGDCYHVVSSRGNSLDAILDGFIIQHGFANGEGSVTPDADVIARNLGGGIALRGLNTAMSFKNLIIRANESTSFGAGVYLRGSGANKKYTFDGVIFEDNIAGGSAGALAISFTSTTTTVSINNCDFNNNSGKGDGGGAILTSNTAGILNVTNSRFVGNSHDLYGGAVRHGSGGVATFTSCTFTGNNAMSRGGALYVTGEGRANIISCTFDANTSSEVGGHIASYSGTTDVAGSIFKNGISTTTGGAFHVFKDATVHINSSEIINNQSNTSGSGLFSLGTVIINKSLFKENTSLNNATVYTVSKLEIFESRFLNNTVANEGGAIFAYSNTTSNSDVYIKNSLFYNNIANGSGTTNVGGGAIYVSRDKSEQKASVTAINNTFYANHSPNSPHGALSVNGTSDITLNFYNNIFNGNTGNAGPNDIRPVSSPILNFKNNLFQVFNVTPGGNDIISGNYLEPNPSALFSSTDPSKSNFLYLATGSYAIDKGDGIAYGSSLSTDLDILGNARLIDGTDNNVDDAVIDLGAIEWNSTLPVKVKTFNAKANKNIVNLSWSVGLEDNVNHYIVERSTNGADFKEVAKVLAVGNNSYTSNDLHPVNGVSYYRLTSVDNDGTKAIYKDLKSVNFSLAPNTVLSVYPNPIQANNFDLNLSGYPAGQYSYSITNAAGLTVAKGIFNYDGSSAPKISLNAKGGLYVLSLTNGNLNASVKLIKL
jgi:hypothetical protein